MARGQCHLFNFAHIPGGNDHSSAIGIRFDHIHHLGDLIDSLTIGPTPASPLMTVHRSEVTLFVGPFIPNAHAMFLKVGNIGVAL